ncbi:MAG: hypothetical protein Q8S26_07565 [Azonexus sp.]|nr:hypothetical protein [Azonexus sp.]
MPHLTNWENNSFYAKFWGEVPATEIEMVNTKFLGDFRFEEVRYSFWDMSRISKLTAAESDIEYAAAIDKGASTIRPRLRGAIVVPETGQVREMVEQYLAISAQVDTSWDTRLFTNADAAKTWLASR